MTRSHGKAVRLHVADIDFALFDQVVKDGGVGEEATRMAMANDFLGPKRFGKLFPTLDTFRPPDDALIALSRLMLDPAPQAPEGNSTIASGLTYLGQFVDHDLTLDQTADFPVIDDPAEIEQGRTPTIDLDSVYGLGPVREPDLYEPGPPERARFRVGRTSPNPSPGGIGLPDVPTDLPNDLPRRPLPSKDPVIPDPRNDQHLIVAQMHLAFLKFHNKVIDTLPSGSGPVAPTDSRYTKAEEDTHDTPFHQAHRLVRWHYQWIVLHELVRTLVDGTVLDDVLANGRKFYRFEDAPFDGRPFMPLEFSVAAYRLGHSMAREAYNHNRVFNSVEPTALADGTLSLLFLFTGHGGFAGDVGLPSNWVIDWRRFFDLGHADEKFVNRARQLNTLISPQLHDLPTGVAAGRMSLPERNLLRGSRVGLPAAQDVAKAMGITALTADELAGGADGPTLREHGFHTSTPLWYYILREAGLQGGGERLGEMGSRILSEVFVGLLQGDPHSFLSKQPDWTPTLPSARPGEFTMAALLRFVNDINPIGASATEVRP